MPAGIGVFQRFLAGVGNLALGVVKLVVKVVRLICQREDALAQFGTHDEFGFVHVIGFGICLGQ